MGERCSGEQVLQTKLHVSVNRLACGMEGRTPQERVTRRRMTAAPPAPAWTPPRRASCLHC